MERKEKLLHFLAFLKEELNFNFNKDSFEDRIKLQKYVRIAKLFGLDLGYRFNLYLRGPYSPDLASDYYGLSGPMPELARLDNFDSKKFLKMVRDKDTRWLETAATIISVKDNNPGISDDRVIAIVAEIKNIGEEEVSEVFSEVKALTS
ncbi:MAG: hypothetical protein QXS27_08150 [Candidatus Jordarchaeaceae archaeon]